MIRILIADDHPVIHQGLSSLLGLIEGLSVVGKAANGREAVTLYRVLKPDIVLMDMAMPEMDGAEAIAAICREFPDARVIALTVYAGEEDIFRAFQAGAKAYLLKKSLVEEIVGTIRMVHGGGTKIPVLVAQSLSNRKNNEALSERELEVLRMTARGESNDEIAAHLGITLRTAKAHITSIMAKLGATNRTQAVAIAVRKGHIHLE